MAVIPPIEAFVIIGLGFGDEGKGLATDYLARISPSPLVIRFNGGHQAGHTVVTSEGKSHVFSAIGAGTFRGAPTYWSKHCTFSPSILLLEIDSLTCIPKIFLDELCPVTTHYDILYNRVLESSRGDSRHGSCGLGFGATVLRNNDPELTFYVKDLLEPQLCELALTKIRSYYKQKINTETSYDFDNFTHDEEDTIFYQQISSIKMLLEKGILNIVKEDTIFGSEYNWKTLIFEGAQGILLDKTYGFQPHITQSNTTSRNALELLQIYKPDLYRKARIVYVTRSYLTRHGAGPIPQLQSQPILINTEKESNHYNDYQGYFRIAHLNIDLLNYAISCDDIFSNKNSKWLLVTCLDQLNCQQLTCCHRGEAVTISYNRLPGLINSEFERCLFSFSSCSDGLAN